MSEVKDNNLTEASEDAHTPKAPDKSDTQTVKQVSVEASEDTPVEAAAENASEETTADDTPVETAAEKTVDISATLTDTAAMKAADPDAITLPVRPEEMGKNGVETVADAPAKDAATEASEEDNEKKPRPGEITEDMLQQRTSTRKLGDTDFEDGTRAGGTARFNKRMLLEIKLRDTGERFTFDYDDIEEIVIGRRDPNTGDSPAVDLENHGGLNKGVSRRHAAIVRRDGALNLVDRGSPNGTFLNGQKLVPEQPRILRDGDDVRLGHLVVRVSFRPADMG